MEFFFPMTNVIVGEGGHCVYLGVESDQGKELIFSSAAGALTRRYIDSHGRELFDNYSFGKIFPVHLGLSISLVEYLGSNSINNYTWSHVIGTQIRVDIHEGVFQEPID